MGFGIMLTKKLKKGDNITLGADEVVVSDILYKETAGGNEEGKKVGEFRYAAAHSPELTTGTYIRQVLNSNGEILYSDTNKNHEFQAKERLKIKELLSLPRNGYLFFEDPNQTGE